MNPLEAEWFRHALEALGLNNHVEIVYYSIPAFVFLILLIILIRKGNKKKAHTAPAVNEHKTAKEDLTSKPQGISNETSEGQDKSEGVSLKEETVAEVKTDYTEPATENAPSQTDAKSEESKQKDSSVLTVRAFKNNMQIFYLLMPHLKYLDALEDFRDQGITTLDIRDNAFELMKYAGLEEILLEPRSVYKSNLNYQEELINYLFGKTREIDDAFMSNIFKPEHYLAIGCYYYHKGRFTEALDRFDLASALNQYHPAPWNNRAVTLMEMDLLEESLNSFEKAILLNKDIAQAWFGKAIILMDRGDYNEGLSCLDKALEINPLYGTVWYEKGLALTAQDRFEESLESFERASIINQKDERPWQSKAIAFSRLGRHEEAYIAYEKALTIKPDDEEAWYGKAVALSYLGFHDKAINSFDFALAINRDNLKAWFGRGLAHFYIKKYDDAIKSYERTLTINPSYAKAWYNKAIAHILNGDKDNAIESLKRAVEIDPKYRDKAKNSGEFESLRDNEDFIKILQLLE